VRRPTLTRTSLVVLAATLTGAQAAPSADPLSAARVAVGLPRTADGMQARYDAGRALEISQYARRTGCPYQLSFARGLVRWAEGYDRQVRALEIVGRREALAALDRVTEHCPSERLVSRLPRLPQLPPLGRAAPPRTRDEALDARLSTLGRTFPGYAAIWVHDLVRGTTASWNADARFPAASTVKLGVLLSALQRLRRPERSVLDYELRAMSGWSSSLATNLLVRRFGPGGLAARRCVSQHVPTGLPGGNGSCGSRRSTSTRLGTCHDGARPRTDPLRPSRLRARESAGLTRHRARSAALRLCAPASPQLRAPRKQRRPRASVCPP
jgi:beta-lactamase family protein